MTDNINIVHEVDYVKVNGRRFCLHISPEQIADRVSQMGKSISIDYSGKPFIALVVLKGAFVFAADLVRHIKGEFEIEMIKAKSYGDSMKTSGTVLVAPNNIDVDGRHVLLIEDIIDTGLTLDKLVSILKGQGAASVEIASFLSKPEQRRTDINVKYIGVEIPPAFVVGYGLDYAEQGRELPGIYILDE